MLANSVTHIEGMEQDLHTELSRLRQKIAQLEDEVAEKDDTIKELTRQLTERDFQMRGRDAELKMMRNQSGPASGGIWRSRHHLREHFPEHMERLERKAKRTKVKLWDLVESDKKLATARADRQRELRRVAQNYRRAWERRRMKIVLDELQD